MVKIFFNEENKPQQLCFRIAETCDGKGIAIEVVDENNRWIKSICNITAEGLYRHSCAEGAGIKTEEKSGRVALII
jgi:hypothetical protein